MFGFPFNSPALAILEARSVTVTVAAVASRREALKPDENVGQ